MNGNNEKSSSKPRNTSSTNEDSDRAPHASETFAVPDLVASSGSLDRLVDTAKEYARQATADNTNTAYKADWAHFNSWCRRRGADPLPPSAELDLSRFRAAPSARLSDLPFESDRAFPAQC